MDRSAETGAQVLCMIHNAKVIALSLTSLNGRSCLFPQVPGTNLCKISWVAPGIFSVVLVLSETHGQNKDSAAPTAGAGLPTTCLNTSFAGATKNHFSRAVKAQQSLVKS